MADARNRHTAISSASPALADANPGARRLSHGIVFRPGSVMCSLAVPGETHLDPTEFVAVNLFTRRPYHESDLGSVNPWFGVGLGSPGDIAGSQHQFVVVFSHASRLGAVLFQCLGLLSVMDDRDQLPVAVEACSIVAGKLETHTRCKFRQVADRFSGHCLVA